MKLSKEEVQKIAQLARIAVTDEEVEVFQKELTSVFDYVDQLAEVPTEDVEPIAHVTGMVHELASDVVSTYQDTEALIDAAPEKASGQVKTKRIL